MTTFAYSEKLDDSDQVPAAIVQPIPVDFAAANLESSLRADGSHDVVLDLDVSHEYRPSATPGHGHLVVHLPQGLEWSKYKDLLFHLAEAGVIQTGFYSCSAAREASYVRRAGIFKGDK